ncbi:FdhF/YdeP family oxidoreductase [Cupriavidus sp. AU9028]|uniref:FdhF/YdeP family oxidoreductase n=1 Tax=Cupriavidus sp. AU9028 TaxID=2871157 RepID=UPI001C952DB2|nr:FdhF/YdeP family oxidoreductase [Cupriavidus sp. AU9028]MBY4896261.1 FdhF/YdeP family oxidoreductase [Cupriavidus sp. AU9028]
MATEQQRIPDGRQEIGPDEPQAREQEGRRDLTGVGQYGGPAGGWGALQAVARTVRRQMGAGREAIMLLRVNQPDGFDCPGCAWPDPRAASSFEFCENGAKAVAWEATTKRTTPEFFARHTVAQLWEMSDFELEDEGRLTHPMAYDAASDRYVPISWEDAFARIGAAMQALPGADAAEFYTSGRASNEAAFLFQLFAREFGTNNFPDCSNMCHEATSVGLPESIGVGKGTVTLEDFDHCDAIFSFGHNPGTNHPRMLSTLRAAARRGAPIVVINPLRERGLERFLSPQHPIEMTLRRPTELATMYLQPKIGGDVAVIKGMMKTLLALDELARQQGGEPVIDHAFVAEHTDGYEALVADLQGTGWDDIEAVSGLPRAEIEAAAQVYAQARRVIVCYGMGITQHRQGTANVQQLCNLLLMRGNIGREGAGICPLRGHSNVQGDRTVGITEIPTADFLDRLDQVFGIQSPRRHGHNAVETVKSIQRGDSRAMISLGGNFAVAMPDPEQTFEAMRKLDLAVHIATKLNRSHLLIARQSLILPCLGRTERDEQNGAAQSVTVEDSMSMVHVSRGTLPPASPHLRSEPWIVAQMAKATLPRTRIDWDGFVADYAKIRDAIEAVFADFHDYNDRVSRPLGFRLRNTASERIWRTPSGRANFIPMAGLNEDPRTNHSEALMLATIRSHDQYNTTIYGANDRYRGITGRRDVVFMNERDLADRGLRHGDLVDLEAVSDTVGVPGSRVLRGLTAVAFPISRGSVAAYYPEANCLVELVHFDPRSGTPSYKSVPIFVRRSRAAPGTAPDNSRTSAQRTQPATVPAS